MSEVFTLEELRTWPAGGAPLNLAVVGDPVAHSASPPMHNAALSACGIAQTYGRLHISPGELMCALGELRRLHFTGVNLTIPHKTAILPLLDSVDERAGILGAVNTVRLRGGRAKGFNTDGPGLERSVEECFGVALGSLRVLVVGAGGGAGRAIALHCALAGCPHLALVNRTQAKAQELASEIRALPRAPGVVVVSMDREERGALASAANGCELIIQCSSVGMQAEDPSPLDPALLKATHLVYDTIYSAPTRLLRDAAAVGARTANGLSMLLHQGALAFEIWFERDAPVEVMRAALLGAIQPLPCQSTSTLPPAT